MDDPMVREPRCSRIVPIPRFDGLWADEVQFFIVGKVVEARRHRDVPGYVPGEDPLAVMWLREYFRWKAEQSLPGGFGTNTYPDEWWKRSPYEWDKSSALQSGS